MSLARFLYLERSFADYGMMTSLLDSVRERWFSSGRRVRDDTFPSMKALLSSVAEKNTYTFEICASRLSPIKLFAPHGGCIEPGTGPLVRELAGSEYDYYIFRGLLKGGGCRKLLHVMSTHYNEERCQAMARSALLSVAVHGCRGGGRRIEIGGGNKELAADLYRTLKPRYPVMPASAERNGGSPLNFINTSRYQGVQLEISEGFRSDLFLGYPRSLTGNPETLPEFVNTLRTWLKKIGGTIAA